MKLLKAIKYFITIILIIIIIGGAFVGIYLYKTTKQNVQQVTALQSEVTSIAEQEGMSEYLEVIYGIIYVESKGLGNDVMQASESKYGEVDQITTSEESIEAGIQFLKSAVERADELGCDIWTAVQAYNFGLSYIDYVAQRGGTNSLEIAEEYSRDVLAVHMGNTTNTQYRYLHIESFFYNGGYLYQNGGNFFYAKRVEHAIDIIKFHQ